MDITHPEQVSHTLVKTRREHAVDVEEDRICRLAVKFLAKKIDHCFELHGG